MKHSEYLRALLKEKKVKTRYLYEKMDISKSSINFKINGERPWKPNEIDILIDSLNMSYEEIFRKENADIIKNDDIKVSIGGNFYIVPREITKSLKTVLSENGIKERKVSNG